LAVDEFIKPMIEVFAGMDLGDRSSRLYVEDAQGRKVCEEELRTTPAGLRAWFEGRPRMRVVVEAGTHSPWVSRLLCGLGHEVVVANPRKLALITSNDSKSDRRDAELLCRLGRLDVRLLHPVEHRSAEAMVVRSWLRSRDVVVRMRTQLVNHARGVVKATGERLPRTSAQGFARKARGAVPEPLREVLGPVFEVLEQLNGVIRGYDEAIEKLAQERHPETALMRQVAGVGPVTSLAIAASLEDPSRFASSRAVGSYLGLRPRRAQSGGFDPELRITKAGDPFVRRLLVLSAHYILGPKGPDTDLRRFGLRLAARGGKGAKKRAVVAVARKLAVLLHRLWVTGEVYEPLRQANRAARPAA
jgi:transposase